FSTEAANDSEQLRLAANSWAITGKFTGGTMLAWVQSMTWKGLEPVIQLSKKVYKKGISLTKKAMREVEKKLERNPLLPKWDILIKPLEMVNSF
ncbi:MAG TPA: hypothetical protein P5102_17085, partial [Candidatus Competibacteraceae bacterium]|nr:hypothetical protein [Candidatus Competibacteraceae bacterium]HSA46875.1 hypothetical protein [Candidatus Competibacteraceae bacterium]